MIANEVRGTVGCGTFHGTLQASGGTVALQLLPDPPAAGVRCLYSVPNPFLNTLNSATRYLISSDTRHLVLYSATARLTFERLGYVTPAHKGN